jgi:hypothetical protein
VIQRLDEDVHLPDGQPDWQENFLFHGWDNQFLNGFYLHLQYLPGQSLVDVRVGVALDGEMTTLVTHSIGENAYDAPGLKVEIVEPFKHIRLRYAGRGRRGADGAGWFFSGEGDTPFMLEIDMWSKVEPISWLDFIRDMFPDDNTGAFIRANHYETGGRWDATIRADQTERRVTGFAWRDHSWGPRKFFADRTFWNPMVLDEGRTFVSAMTILYDSTWRGFAVESSAGKPPLVLGNYWARPHGDLVPGGFEVAESVGFGDGTVRHYRFDVERFIPAPRNWTVSGQGSRGIVDVVSRVISEGRTGIGTFQFSPYAIETGP